MSRRATGLWDDDDVVGRVYDASLARRVWACGAAPASMAPASASASRRGFMAKTIVPRLPRG